MIIASTRDGTVSGAVMTGSDTVVAIGNRTSFLNGLHIDENAIDSVEVLKSATKFGPLPIGVIVIQLKADSK
jgi:hypothetical protein